MKMTLNKHFIIQLFIVSNIILSFISCGSSNGILSSNIDDIKPAIAKASANFSLKTAEIDSNNFIPIYNNETKIGKIQLRDTSNNLVAYNISMKSAIPNLNHKIFSDFFAECIKQEIEFEKKTLTPKINSPKQYSTYLTKTLISPTWGNFYLIENHPLLFSGYKNFLIKQSIFGDGLSLTIITSGLITKDVTLIQGGIFFAAFFRLLNLMNLSYIGQYNQISNLNYNFNKIELHF